MVVNKVAFDGPCPLCQDAASPGALLTSDEPSLLTSQGSVCATVPLPHCLTGPCSSFSSHQRLLPLRTLPCHSC